MPDTTPANIEIRHSTCPHDCPSSCALEVERLDANTIGRVRGASANTYTDGVICAKVARYAERAHHPDRLMHPLMRTGPKGSKEFKRVSWDEALDVIAKRFLEIEKTSGPEAIWPYFYAGTMGMVMRDGINRLRHVKGIPASIPPYARPWLSPVLSLALGRLGARTHGRWRRVIWW